jgi:G3E family GTPase
MLTAHTHDTHTPGVENESVEQVGFADRILLSKLDLVDAECEQAVRKRLAQINAAVEIIPVNKGVVDLAKILNIKAFDLDKILVRALPCPAAHTLNDNLPLAHCCACVARRTWTPSSFSTRSTSTTSPSPVSA